jgi:hypothetical protein
MSKDSLEVGMTYDNVERYMGKPSEIARGFTEVKSERGLPGNDIGILARHSISLDKFVTFPSGIDTKGQLLYVNWRYQDTLIDSSTVLTFPLYRDVSTGTHPIYDLEINAADADYQTQKVSAAEYKKFNVGDDVMVEVISTNPVESKIRSPETPDERKNSFKVLKKFIANVSNGTTKLTSRDTTMRYLVYKQYSILFDASSGRLTNKGYYPVAVGLK